jgi:signal transduction histidine kinase
LNTFIAGDQADFWSGYLAKDSRIAVLLLDSAWAIRYLNQGALQMLGLPRGEPQTKIESLLDSESLTKLKSLSLGVHNNFMLNFVLAGHSSLVLRCGVHVSQTQILIAGESPFYTQEDSLEQISALNTELIQMSRDLVREKRQIKALQKLTDNLNRQLETHIQRQNSELTDAFHLLEQDQLHIIELQEKASIALQAKSELLRHMSHELRTPLNSILGYAEILGKILPPAQAHYAKKIYSSGRHELRYIDELLEVLRLEKADIVPELASVSLVEMLSVQVLALSKRCQLKKLDFELDADLVPETVLLNLAIFEKLLQRLIDYALEVSIEGVIRLQIKSFWQENKYSLEFAISDTGPKMTQTNQDLLFCSSEPSIPLEKIEYSANLLSIALSRYQAHFLGGEFLYEYRDQNVFVLKLANLSYSGKQVELKSLPVPENETRSIFSKMDLPFKSLMSLWQNVRGKLVLNDIEDFINKLELYHFESAIIDSYIADLNRKLRTFELEDLIIQLEDFPALLTEYQRQNTLQEQE